MDVVSEPVKKAVSEPVKDAGSAPVKDAVSEPVKDAVSEPVKDVLDTVPPSASPVTYVPGLLAEVETLEGKMMISAGLKCTIIAKSGEKVTYKDGNTSDIEFHDLPDAGNCFRDTNGTGWIYVSNSEVKKEKKGGVGALTFDSEGNIIKYQMILKGSTHNCGGGMTPWQTWVSCEEKSGRDGQCWQTDPTGQREAQQTVLGGEGGKFESFAYDNRDPTTPRFFVTEDSKDGALRRFTPSADVVRNATSANDPWTMLHGSGVLEYLVLHPEGENSGNFSWSSDIEEGRKSAEKLFKNCEGIDSVRGKLYFVAKKQKEVFSLDLGAGTYTKYSTYDGYFNGQPDQIKWIISNNGILYMYFTEDGGKPDGIHGRDKYNRFFTVLEGTGFKSETTGLAFSTDDMHMYVAFQKVGLLFDCFREDGYPFIGRTLDVRYHQVEK